jgi:16S rRNA A1518/A1519 N6-dimethyltransferase RsmA/KsgA/DIM1 with predicted DNA glycosylase/AP lyase activity
MQECFLLYFGRISIYVTNKLIITAKLFDAFVRTVQLQDNAKLWEIGPGTDQATKVLARVDTR